MKFLKIFLFCILLTIPACSISSKEFTEPEIAFSSTGHTPSAKAPIKNEATSSPFYRIWKPAIGTSWQWQLDDLPADLSINAQVFDIDLFENDATVVEKLHQQGRKAICYLNAGSWENWRPDKDQFPASVIGKSYEGWPGEKWLDIRQIDLLAPLLRTRLDLCRQKGFDAVEPDNLDGFSNDTGFPIKAADQIRYNIWLADEAHQRGLSIGLKNDPDQAAELEPYFDWAMTEDCFEERWCNKMLPFIQKGKAVLSAEYTDTGASLDTFCPQAKELQFAAMLKNRELDAYRIGCP